VTTPGDPTPLRRNRDFQLLWSGQVVSDIGSRVAMVAFPLLVLAVTGSPAKAGLTMFAETIPMLLLMLPAGAVADRRNRKHVMLTADTARALAMGSLAVALALDALTYPHIVLVAVVEGVGFAFFSVAERAATSSSTLCSSP
jgi:MFS family permease